MAQHAAPRGRPRGFDPRRASLAIAQNFSAAVEGGVTTYLVMKQIQQSSQLSEEKLTVLCQLFLDAMLYGSSARE